MNSLMLCLLTETIIRLLQGTYASPMAPASSTLTPRLIGSFANVNTSFLKQPAAPAEERRKLRSRCQLLPAWVVVKFWVLNQNSYSTV